MPAYDFKCNDCEIELLDYKKKMADPNPLCPECNTAMRTLIRSQVPIEYKTLGFYNTDRKRYNENKFVPKEDQ